MKKKNSLSVDELRQKVDGFSMKKLIKKVKKIAIK